MAEKDAQNGYSIMTISPYIPPDMPLEGEFQPQMPSGESSESLRGNSDEAQDTENTQRIPQKAKSPHKSHKNMIFKGFDSKTLKVRLAIENPVEVLWKSSGNLRDVTGGV